MIHPVPTISESWFRKHNTKEKYPVSRLKGRGAGKPGSSLTIDFEAEATMLYVVNRANTS